MNWLNIPASKLVTVDVGAVKVDELVEEVVLTEVVLVECCELVGGLCVVDMVVSLCDVVVVEGLCDVVVVFGL